MSDYSTNFDLVREFHEKFIPERIPDQPGLREENLRRLRVELILEEVEELIEALEKDDMVATADALTDILYVTYGGGVDFGIDLNRCFQEVHRSNMSKLGADGKVIKNQSGKVMKGPKYSPPDLKFVVQGP